MEETSNYELFKRILELQEELFEIKLALAEEKGKNEALEKAIADLRSKLLEKNTPWREDPYRYPWEYPPKGWPYEPYKDANPVWPYDVICNGKEQK